MKIKRQKPTIKTIVTKTYDGENYVFVNGVAKVPGVFFKKKIMLITLLEFNELSKVV